MWVKSDDVREYAYYQFGMQRTGTTIIDVMCRLNFGVWKANDHSDHLDPYSSPMDRPDHFIWKHALDVPGHLPEDAPVILNYKNPYTLMESFAFRRGVGNGNWQNTHGKDERFDKHNGMPRFWIDQPGHGRTYIIQVAKAYKHWFETWLDFYEKNKDRTVLIKWEDILEEDKRKTVFDEIKDKFGWQDPIHDPYKWPPHVGSSQPITSRVDYYIEGKPTRLERHHIDKINEVIGTDLISRVGYDII